MTVLPAGYEALARPLRFLTPRQLSRREASLVALSKLSAFDATCALLERAEPLALLSTALRQHALAYTRPDENPLPPGTGEDGDGSDASVFAVATQAACNALAHCARARHVHRASLVALRAVLAHGAVRPLVALCSLPCTDAAPDWASQDEVEDLAEAALALLSALPPHTGPRGTAVLAGVKEDLRVRTALPLGTHSPTRHPLVTAPSTRAATHAAQCYGGTAGARPGLCWAARPHRSLRVLTGRGAGQGSSGQQRRWCIRRVLPLPRPATLPGACPRGQCPEAPGCARRDAGGGGGGARRCLSRPGPDGRRPAAPPLPHRAHAPPARRLRLRPLACDHGRGDGWVRTSSR